MSAFGMAMMASVLMACAASDTTGPEQAAHADAALAMAIVAIAIVLERRRS